MENLYNEVYDLIKNETNDNGTDFTSGKFNGLGWYFYHYKCSTHDGPYPRIALKQQKNGVHVYTALWENNRSILQEYEDVFGKSNLGQGCIRLKKLTPERQKALREILGKARARNLRDSVSNS